MSRPRLIDTLRLLTNINISSLNLLRSTIIRQRRKTLRFRRLQLNLLNQRRYIGLILLAISIVILHLRVVIIILILALGIKHLDHRCIILLLRVRIWYFILGRYGRISMDSTWLKLLQWTILFVAAAFQLEELAQLLIVVVEGFGEIVV